MIVIIFLFTIALPSNNNSSIKSANLPMSKHGISSDKGMLTSDSGIVVAHDVKVHVLEGKTYQSESNTDSSTL